MKIEFENWFNRPLDDNKGKMFAFNLLPTISAIYETNGFLSICVMFLFWTLTFEKKWGKQYY